MNNQTISGSMKEMGAKIKQQWSKMTDDDVGLFEANKDEFFARLEKNQGIARDEAERTMKEWK